MYQSGDLIVYGSTGVCRVEGTKQMQKVREPGTALYYILRPLFRNGVIYCPVDHPKVFIRPLISEEEARQLMAEAEFPERSVFCGQSPRELAEKERASLESHNCRTLLKLVCALRAKQKMQQAQHKRLGQTDERFLTRGEELLYGELSVALNITPEEVKQKLKAQIEAAEKEDYDA